jgi:putative transposase
MAAVRLMPIHVSRVPKGCDTWDLEGSSCRPVLVGRAMMQGRRDGDRESGPVAVFPPASGRAAAMPRLLDLDSRGELSAAHVRLVAKALGKSERTVWRWLAAARKDHRLARVEAPHLTVTTEVRRRLLALWGGNASRVHAELVQRAADDPNAPAVPSLSTLHRAIRRDLTHGERAGLKSGEAARRAHDVFGQRPPHRRPTLATPNPVTPLALQTPTSAAPRTPAATTGRSPTARAASHPPAGAWPRQPASPETSPPRSPPPSSSAGKAPGARGPAVRT